MCMGEKGWYLPTVIPPKGRHFCFRTDLQNRAGQVLRRYGGIFLEDTHHACMHAFMIDRSRIKFVCTNACACAIDIAIARSIAITGAAVRWLQ